MGWGLGSGFDSGVDSVIANEDGIRKRLDRSVRKRSRQLFIEFSCFIFGFASRVCPRIGCSGRLKGST